MVENLKENLSFSWSIQTEKREITAWRPSSSVLYDHRATIFSKQNARWGGPCGHEPKERIYGQLTCNLLSKNNSLRVPLPPPPPNNHLPAQPGSKKENWWPQNGLLYYIWQAPPPPPPLHPGLRTKGILYKSCSILQGVDWGVVIIQISQICKN